MPAHRETEDVCPLHMTKQSFIPTVHRNTCFDVKYLILIPLLEISKGQNKSPSLPSPHFQTVPNIMPKHSVPTFPKRSDTAPTQDQDEDMKNNTDLWWVLCIIMSITSSTALVCIYNICDAESLTAWYGVTLLTSHYMTSQFKQVRLAAVCSYNHAEILYKKNSSSNNMLGIHFIHVITQSRQRLQSIINERPSVPSA